MNGKLIEYPFIEKTCLIRQMGPSGNIAKLAADVNRVAKSNFSVIIIGETGTGKELVSRAIHENSSRSAAPFIAVDCGAIPENLIESELFGYEKGSFTGADQQKLGKFELAHGGTLFMDEIGNMSLSAQAKVLRVIQDLKLYRVGGVKPVKIDTRLIVAANMDLYEMSNSGMFRLDLYYRLNEFTIRIPALRERREDIAYLAKYFLDQANSELKKSVTDFSSEAMKALMSYDWPGNVRQLRSSIRRATLEAKDTITEKDLNITTAQVAGKKLYPIMINGMPWENTSLSEIVRQSIFEVEIDVLSKVLKYTGGNKAQAARLLQIDYKTILTKVKKFGILQNGGIND